MKFQIAAAIFLLVQGGTATQAQEWFVEVNGPDVFGETHVQLTVSLDNSNDMIVLKCSSKPDSEFAWLIYADVKEPRPLVANILLRSESSGTLKVPAQLIPWNEKYVALSTTDPVDVAKVLAQIGTAQKSIEVGFTVDEIDLKSSGSITARGSTSASEKFIKNCFNKGFNG